jgi:hypothetical protein
MEMAHPDRSSWEQAQHTWHADRRTVRRYEEYPAKFADLYADAASRVDIGKGKDAETSFVLQYRRRLEEKPTAVQHAEAHLDSTATQLAAAKAAHAEAETAHAEVIAST